MLVEENPRKNLKKNWVGGSWEEIYYRITPKIDQSRYNRSILGKHNQRKNLKNPRMLVRHNKRKNLKKKWGERKNIKNPRMLVEQNQRKNLKKKIFLTRMSTGKKWLFFT